MAANGPNEAALVRTLHERGVQLTALGDLAALVTLARTLAREIDAADAPTASMAGVYLQALRLLLAATEPEEVHDVGPADTLARLRAL
jgi:hypothetical protein